MVGYWTSHVDKTEGEGVVGYWTSHVDMRGGGEVSFNYIKYHDYIYSTTSSTTRRKCSSRIQSGRMGIRTPQPRIRSWHLIHKAIAATDVGNFARPSYLSPSGP